MCSLFFFSHELFYLLYWYDILVGHSLWTFLQYLSCVVYNEIEHVAWLFDQNFTKSSLIVDISCPGCEFSADRTWSMHASHHICSLSFNDATALTMVPYRELFGKKCNCTSGVAMISACGCRSCKLYRVYKVAVCCLLTNEPCSGGKSTVGCLTWNQRTILFLSTTKKNYFRPFLFLPPFSP